MATSRRADSEGGQGLFLCELDSGEGALESAVRDWAGDTGVVRKNV